MTSRFENATQAPSHDRRISHPLQRIPCGRCDVVIEYDRGAKWSAVSELVNEHWKTCPGKPHAKPARMTRTLTSPLDRAIVLPPPVASKQRSGSNLVVESISSANNTWISAGCERKRRTLEQRKLELEQDEYAKNVTTKSVVCAGCHKEISLDKRSKYYPGLWLKHRSKCPGIEKLERPKAKAPQVLNSTRPVTCDVIIPALGSNGHQDVLQFSPAERYQSSSTAATHQLVRHYDSEDPSSEDVEEDEEEDGDVLPQEPFATLNDDFYRTWRLYNRSDEWAYRYATKDEIGTNFFRGQDESYARPDSGARPFTRHSLQTGGHCETLRCVLKNRVEVPYADNFRSTKELNKPGQDLAPHSLWNTDPLPR